MHARAQWRNAYSQVDKDPVAEAHKKEMEELRLVGAGQLLLRFLSSMNTIPCLPVSASLCLCTREPVCLRLFSCCSVCCRLSVCLWPVCTYRLT